MIAALTKGVVLGLSAGLSPGPLFMLVVTQTLRHGAREGVKVAVAPLLTDLPIILVALLVLARLSEFNTVLGVLSLAGGLYILYIAYESTRVGPLDLETVPGQAQSLRKGVLVNALNPHPYLFWATVGAPLVITSHGKHRLAPALFFLCFYTSLVGSKMLLAVIAGRSKAFLKGRAYLLVMRVLAVLLALLAFLLISEGLGFLRAAAGSQSASIAQVMRAKVASSTSRRQR